MDAPKKLNAYEIAQREIAEARERDKEWQAELREKAARTVANMEAAEAQEARDAATENEATFRADEREKYIRAGGSEFQFNQDWTRLRQQIVERRYLSGEAAPLSEGAAAAKRHLDSLYRRE